MKREGGSVGRHSGKWGKVGGEHDQDTLFTCIKLLKNILYFLKQGKVAILDYIWNLQSKQLDIPVKNFFQMISKII